MIYQHINLDYLDTMSGGEPDTRKYLLQLLIKELEGALPDMRRLLQQERWNDLLKVSHHLKTTLPFAGNPAISNANRFIEQSLLQATNGQRVSALLEQMERQMPLVIGELRQELQLAEQEGKG